MLDCGHCYTVGNNQRLAALPKGRDAAIVIVGYPEAGFQDALGADRRTDVPWASRDVRSGS